MCVCGLHNACLRLGRFCLLSLCSSAGRSLYSSLFLFLCVPVTSPSLLSSSSHTRSQLRGAVKDNRLQEVTRLLARPDRDQFIDDIAWGGFSADRTALLIAAEHDRREIAKALIAAGADLNVKSSEGYDNKTALEIARQKGHHAMVELLQTDPQQLQEAARRAAEQEARRAAEEEQKRATRAAEEEQKRATRAAEQEAARQEAARRAAEQEAAREEEGRHAEEAARRLAEQEARRRVEQAQQEEAIRQRQQAEEDEKRAEQERKANDAPLDQLRDNLTTNQGGEPSQVPLQYLSACTLGWSPQRLLGQGIFGKVYRGVDDQRGIRFVVKRIDLASLATVTEDPSRLGKKMWEREVAALTRFHNPSIVKLIGYTPPTETVNNFCLVYELCAGGALDQALQDDKPLAAVHYLHRGGGGGGQGCFHRDIKAANICLTQTLQPKLIDCGLAKFIPDANEGAHATATEGRPGTPGYKC
eukprot:CAMPEP_0175155666 /NCGR_PEP_ID=MMETSP0087-20121206/21125_1 /TAXON_ID=136419 /ORGANISM="Unknown Unknown, Strain D1" /LENGTH=472 /DNA_ID=CAMNT_0016442893 /DNA_START=52 /DNA_END=1468 /DNA_ORIENTATION=-